MNMQLQLSQALERIWHWFQVNAPAMLTFLQPGLTYGQIDVQVQALPFRLPDEVYQLYQWRNGSSSEGYIEFLPQYRFLSLEDAIDQYQSIAEIWRGLSKPENWQDRWVRPEVWLPVFAEDANFYVIEGQSQPRASAPIIHSCEGNNQLIFNSLTDMMLAIAECLEIGVYFFPQAESGDTYFYLEVDYTKEAQVWLKYQHQRATNVEAILNRQAEDLSPEARLQAYNDLVAIQHPQALFFLVEAIKNAEITDTSLRDQIIHWRGAIENPQAVQYLLNLLEDGDWNNKKRAIQTLVGAIQEKEVIEEFWQPQVVNTGIQLQIGTSGVTREDAVTLREEFVALLEMVGDSRAVTPLISILQNYSRNDWEGRLAAIEALGNLGYPSAIDPLFQIVQHDQDPAIRLAIAKALLTLGDARAREILLQLAQANIPIISEQAQEELS